MPSRRAFLAAQGALFATAVAPSGLLAALAANTPPVPELSDWDSVRRLFRLDPEYLHFSGFYIASHPEPVRQAIEAFRRTLDANPLLTVEHGMFGTDEQNLERKVCEAAAAYIGGRPEEIALTGSTTMGLALVYHGLPLRPGDEILTTEHDHFVHHEAIRLSTQRNGATARRIRLFDRPADATVEGIVAAVRQGIGPNTRVLGITWVQSSTGLRAPVRAIADAVAQINAGRSEDQRVRIVLDGVHGFGSVDAEAAKLGADYFCAGTHKWILGPRGTGLVWASADNWARLRPTVPSFSDLEQYEAWQQEREPRRPNVAARVTPGGFHAYEHHWGMASAFELQQRLGRARATARIAELNGRIKDGLAAIPGITLHTPRDPELSAGINCFELKGKVPDDVVAALLRRKVLASSSPYAVSYARLSGGLMNTPDQVDQALAALREVAKA
ncbi:aminotransferase class V-fold PLP-dependent enzyme [Lysobacter sp. LF1]|uniref:Aminotransferase class V-fold PLP-dependent enzyme n=1 Tax=Lysobacter stagni TaxID=3045172 RepID=A0ABT6XIQ3_9GAMM|nr:aminotransferase class V-fold PLP-dependent enzyme [Lysobacter sp. LF1]MDI9240042.1 aminotransferase class V-fold PLP-dependent enzyme [Lysobacter sp. LF1]